MNRNHRSRQGTILRARHLAMGLEAQTALEQPPPSDVSLPCVPCGRLRRPKEAAPEASVHQHVAWMTAEPMGSTRNRIIQQSNLKRFEEPALYGIKGPIFSSLGLSDRQHLICIPARTTWPAITFIGLSGLKQGTSDLHLHHPLDKRPDSCVISHILDMERYASYVSRCYKPPSPENLPSNRRGCLQILSHFSSESQ